MQRPRPYRHLTLGCIFLDLTFDGGCAALFRGAHGRANIINLPKRQCREGIEGGGVFRPYACWAIFSLQWTMVSSDNPQPLWE